MTKMNAERSMMLQMEAARKLLASLKDQGAGDDAELVADAIEGETSLLEAISIGLDELDECEVLITGLDAKITSFDARRKMQKDRADRIRALIEQALVVADLPSLKLPTATLSLTRRAAAVVITNEADIPARFWVEQDRPAPKLDKRALADALKNEPAIPGAELDNGSVSLSVRRR
jgi:hypothetical protein